MTFAEAELRELLEDGANAYCPDCRRGTLPRERLGRTYVHVTPQGYLVGNCPAARYWRYLEKVAA